MARALIYTEKAETPLYIGPLPHDVRRMLQALDAYWTCYEGMPRGRYPHGSYTAEDWWGRYERYRARVEEAIGGTEAS